MIDVTYGLLRNGKQVAWTVDENHLLLLLHGHHFTEYYNDLISNVEPVGPIGVAEKLLF